MRWETPLHERQMTSVFLADEVVPGEQGKGSWTAAQADDELPAGPGQ